MFIDLIIPTLWVYKPFYQKHLQYYSSLSEINKIIIIDNNKQQRPVTEVLNHEKIKLITPGRNIYVGPSWNEGAKNAEAEIINLLNDDLLVDEEVFKYVSKLDFSNIDIIGFNHRQICNETSTVKFYHDRNRPLGEQCYGFGSCMFLSKNGYPYIPENYQILFTDDYLVHNCTNVYVLNTNKIQGTMSNTLVTLYNNKEIVDRMDLDILNGKRDLLKL